MAKILQQELSIKSARTSRNHRSKNRTYPTLNMATRKDIEDFNTEELCDFLSSTADISEDGVKNFQTHLISGRTFFDLESEDIKELLRRQKDCTENNIIL